MTLQGEKTVSASPFAGQVGSAMALPGGEWLS
jgi:hypothetical protein